MILLLPGGPKNPSSALTIPVLDRSICMASTRSRKLIHIGRIKSMMIDVG